MNQAIGKLGSFKRGVRSPLPRLGLGTLQLTLTGGPGPGGRNCRSPREPWVWGGPRVGIDLGKEPLGRPGADGRVLRGASWPARGGGGLRAACEQEDAPEGGPAAGPAESEPVTANSQPLARAQPR